MNRILSFLLLFLFFLTGCSVGSVRTPSATPQSAQAAAAADVATSSPVPSAAATAAAVPSATPSPIPPDVTSTQAAIPTPPPGPLSGAALVDALRNGGYVIYFRHAATDPTPDDASPVILDDCSTQRHLSTTGEEQARSIGQAFQKLAIPAGRVLASPFCRALDTARLAFGRVEIEPDLENLETSPDEVERDKRTAGLRRLLSTPPDPGTNTILAAHGFNISAAAQVTVSEGGAAVFRPDGNGGFTLVATVPVNAWAALDE